MPSRESQYFKILSNIPCKNSENILSELDDQHFTTTEVDIVKSEILKC